MSNTLSKWDAELLCQLLQQCTQAYRAPNSTERFMLFPELKEIAGYGVHTPHDLFHILVTVNLEQAKKFDSQFRKLLNAYPDSEWLAIGTNYLQMAEHIGDEAYTLRFFAVGKVLDYWDVLLPADFGLKEVTPEDVAKHGFIHITGYEHGRAYRRAERGGTGTQPRTGDIRQRDAGFARGNNPPARRKRNAL